MKATEFIKVILPVSNAILTKAYDHTVDNDRDFIQIHLTRKPNKEVEAMCKENGFTINWDMVWISGQNFCLSQRVWVLRPVNAEDYEFID